MSPVVLILIFLAVFVGIALAIAKLKIDPVLSLLVGTVVLGLLTGINLPSIVDGVNNGFGSLMAEVGLLICLGVVMGFLMSSYGAVQRIVQGILKVFGKRGSPYAFGLTLSTVTPAIYFDVLLVLVAPIARSVARHSRRPIASTAGPVALGLAAGNALVIPGPAMLAFIGTMKISATEALIPGLVISIIGATVSIFIYLFLVERMGWWKPAKDEDPALAGILDSASEERSSDDRKVPSMFTSLAPVLVVLGLILLAIILPLTGIDSAVVSFLGSPVIAMLAGALTALIIVVVKSGLDAQATEVTKALEAVGTILVVTAVAGSLGEIIAGSGMKEVLAGAFAASAVLPLVVVWFIAAIMRMAIGGMTVAGITAIGIISPLVGDLGLTPILVVLAAGAGSCFGGQFSDNAFWMMKSLFGLSTQGALKTYTLSQSVLSVVLLGLIVVADIFI